MRRTVGVVALGLILAACHSGPRLQLHPTGPTAATGPAASPSEQVLPLRRGYLEIGTYGTEVFRPSFTIHIPVSSQWGTFGETGRRVLIGGPAGFFSLQALSAQGSAPLTAAGLDRSLSKPGVHISAVKDSMIAGLAADRLDVVNGPDPFKIDFGGQHVSFFPRERATLWLVRVGTAPVLVVLGVGGAHPTSFRRDAMAALRSVQFQGTS
jgi:hypothetical protein